MCWGLLAGTWALASPLLSVPDEPAHVLRAVSVVRGQLLGRTLRLSRDEPRRVEAIVHEVEVPAGYGGIAAHHECFAHAAGTADCAPPLDPEPGTVLEATSAGAYQPLLYALAGAPSLLPLSPTEAVIAGRLAAAAVGAALLAGATATAWRAGGRVLVAAVAVAVTPMVPYLIGSMNPNGVEIAAAVALWVAVPALLSAPAVEDGALAGSAAAVLAWTRPLAPFIGIGIVLVGLALVLDRGLWSRIRSSGTVRTTAAGAGVAVAAAIVWVVAADALGSFIAFPDPSLTPAAAAAASWELTGDRLEQLVGILGYLDTPLPTWLVWTWAVLALGFALLALVVGRWRDRAIVVALGVGSVLLPVAVEVATAARVGLVWQGRYTLPIAVGFVLVAGWAVARSRRLGGWPARAAVGVVAVAAAGHVVAHVASMSRYSLAPNAPATLRYVVEPGWHAPLPDLLLLAAVVTGALGLIGLVAWAAPDLSPLWRTRRPTGPTGTPRSR